MTKTHNPYKIHTIAIDDDNYESLRKLGRFGESFNDVIRGLISIARREVQEED